MHLKKVSEKEKIDKTTIGLKIQSLIEQHGVSLAKVAAATGLTAETIRQIVNGTIKNPGIETLSKIAEAFSISLFELLDKQAVTAHINKKKIKIIDIFDLQKLKSGKTVNDLIEQSVETIEILYVDNDVFKADFFAVEVNTHLADKLTNSGMPLLKQGDLLIFSKKDDFHLNTIVLVKHNQDMILLGIVMEVEEKSLWIKSVDLPQKQLVIKVLKKDTIGIVHNVQFSK